MFNILVTFWFLFLQDVCLGLLAVQYRFLKNNIMLEILLIFSFNDKRNKPPSAEPEDTDSWIFPSVVKETGCICTQNTEDKQVSATLTHSDGKSQKLR